MLPGQTPTLVFQPLYVLYKELKDSFQTFKRNEHWTLCWMLSITGAPLPPCCAGPGTDLGLLTGRHSRQEQEVTGWDEAPASLGQSSGPALVLSLDAPPFPGCSPGRAARGALQFPIQEASPRAARQTGTRRRAVGQQRSYWGCWIISSLAKNSLILRKPLTALNALEKLAYTLVFLALCS